MTRMSSFTRAPESDYLVDPTGAPDFAALRAQPEFVALRRRIVRFVFPASALFLCWYLTYVLLAAYAPDLMAVRVFGSVNVGMLLGLSQFASTVLIMVLYSRFARRRMDPAVEALKERAGARR
ncbi:DUF485 domain-containing protein [Actinophytocola sp. S1-96]|uniref:DUF485 domain-containing protein n=2 Tax=Actinophytocola gossypii TaxID=2812003 RepID=A0ABT2JCP7_9PSEU|nr:DUF485 domain-containing protein [Actinophytocola gossypii]